MRRRANHIACEWWAHLWPCTRGWTGGLVLWSRTWYWASDLTLRACAWCGPRDDWAVIAPTVVIPTVFVAVVPTVTVVIVPTVTVVIVPTVTVVIVPLVRAVRRVIAYGLVATPLVELVAIQIAVARIGVDAVRAIEHRAVIACAA